MGAQQGDDKPSQSKCCLIAGGSSGLGEACVRRMAAAGWHGVIADIKPPDAHGTQEAADRFIFCRTDTTNGSEVETALAMARERLGPVRGAVICAGLFHAERIAASEGPHDLDAFRRIIEVNLTGTFNVLRLAAAMMRGNDPDEEGQRGVIVTTSSIAAFESQVGQAAYAASKAGVAALTLPAARELGRLGIRVVSIAPGVFETPMMAEVPEEFRRSLQSQIPFPPRFGRPDEFAYLVEHVFGNPMINGDIIRLDGGLRMPAR